MTNIQLFNMIYQNLFLEMEDLHPFYPEDNPSALGLKTGLIVSNCDFHFFVPFFIAFPIW